MRANFSKTQSEVQRKQVTNGTHHFLGPETNKKFNSKRVTNRNPQLFRW